MSDGEAGRMTDPAPHGPTRRMPFGRVVHPFLELPYDIAAEVAGVLCVIGDGKIAFAVLSVDFLSLKLKINHPPQRNQSEDRIGVPYYRALLWRTAGCRFLNRARR
jgi:hypothetical protein